MTGVIRFPKPPHRKKSPQRPFTDRLAGRFSPDPSDLSIKDIIKKYQIPASLVAEAHRAEQRRISGRFDPEKDFGHAYEHFQSCAFDSKLKGTDPKIYGDQEEARSSKKPMASSAKLGWPDGRNVNVITKAFGENAGAFHYRIDRPFETQERPRRRIPWWIANEVTFTEFLRILANENGCEEDAYVLKGHELYRAVGLDWVILYEFYFLGREDKQILSDHVAEFRHERRKAKQRWTSSDNAVKERRMRLVRRGKATFGEEKPVEGPEHREHLARFAAIRRLPDLKPRKQAA